MTVVAYLPAFQAGFIFDDDAHVTGNPALRSLDGLGQIWCQPSATPQYYPLVHTTFWLEYHLWELNPVGYHVVNVLLHTLAAVLLWRALVRLRLPGAWLAAAIFALHPVAVESVAWVTERKNVLSAVFYFAAALAWWRWDRPGGGWRADGAAGRALVLDCAGLVSGRVVEQDGDPFAAGGAPAGDLVETRARHIRDLRLPLPFFMLGAGLGRATSRLEHTQVGAAGPEWAFSLIDRCLIAGRALWFYAGKLCRPARLTYIYPRWEINAGVVVAMGVSNRGAGGGGGVVGPAPASGRGPLVAVLFFAGTLLPALGFSNIYYMRYSLVADHFQYWPPRV